MAKLFSAQEVEKHNTKEDCWVIIHGGVYDLTDFLGDHPGGVKPIRPYFGKDATQAFDLIHPKSILKILPKKCYLGDLDANTVVAASNDSAAATKTDFQKPDISRMLNIYDFEAVASRLMVKEGWDYYSSGADDEITLRENHAAFQRLWFRPRVLVDVRNIDMSSAVLGYKCSMPLYVTATALGKLAHPEGECCLTKACYEQDIIQMCPTLASCSLEEMAGARQGNQVQFFQLYVNQDRKVTEELVRKAEKLGMKALFVTVDAPQLGRREKDMRNKFDDDDRPDVQKKHDVKKTQGTARAISSFIDPSLSWKDIAWLRSITNMEIILKGVQCGEDAVLAAQHGIKGIVLSNHGGRQLDYARSGIEVLVEVMAALKAAGAEKSMEVYVDGGIRRGTDIFKAIALGATAVGIGRPVLYGMAAYGQEGVEKVIQLLKDELEMVMRLMGTPTLADIRPEMICTRNIGDHIPPMARDSLADATYIPLAPAVSRL
eukprot:GFYU01003563.1.p1 GENE.GFYU01003563.1~~GFYU01003563.1.p1  ORF type:complete len:498 (+),score=153.23 GFYU01003563.1:29-1495(+)